MMGQQTGPYPEAGMNRERGTYPEVGSAASGAHGLQNAGMNPGKMPCIYAAPMEGLTGYVFRNNHHLMFGGAARYFTPFVTANQTLSFQTREKRDIAPENNLPDDPSMTVVPQILTKDASQFIWAAAEMAQRGYREVNLNAGCPYPTVTRKGRGAGLLKDPSVLDRLLDGIFEGLEKQKDLFGASGIPKVSVKTRCGWDDPEEAAMLMTIYNRYPLSELIIHPRCCSSMYDGEPDLGTFSGMLAESRNRVCYNGDILSAADYLRLIEMFPRLECVMIGRGLIRDPALARTICGLSGRGENGTGTDGGEAPAAGTTGGATSAAGTAGCAASTAGTHGSGIPAAGTTGGETSAAGTHGSGTPAAGTAGCCTSGEELICWYETLAADFEKAAGGSYALARIKEMWHYTGTLYAPEEKTLKKMKKVRRIEELLEAMRQLPPPGLSDTYGERNGFIR